MQENGWNSWLMACIRLHTLKNYQMESQVHSDTEINELSYVRNLFCVVLCYYMQSVKGGWQHLEETVNFLLLLGDKVCCYCLSCNVNRCDSSGLEVRMNLLQQVFCFCRVEFHIIACFVMYMVI